MSYSSRSPSRGRSRGRNSRSHSQSRNKTNLNGKVVRINERGFGFLEVEDQDDDIFFHSNDIVDNIDIRQLRVGDKVLLDLEASKKKPGRYEGVNVRPEDKNVADRQKQDRDRDHGRDYDRRGGGRDYGRRGGDYRDRDRDYDRRGGRDYDRRGGGRGYDRRGRDDDYQRRDRY